MPATLSVVDDVVVVVLTGARPGLLAKTLQGLESAAGDRLKRWDAVALVNGADDPTLAQLRRHPWIRVESRPGKMRPTGPAISELMELAQASGRRYTLHLEDDWGCMHPVSEWLDRAAFALTKPNVGQVRLRWGREKVMNINMSTGRRIRWSWAQDHAYSENAHMTFNPNLMRTADLEHIYPCRGELDAQANFERRHLGVVQLVPGAFRHLGTDSLRRSLRHGH